MSAARSAHQRSPSQERRILISSKIFVGNLNFKTTSGQLEELFCEVGDVVEVILPNDRATGRPRGFAFVEYSSPEEAAEAITKFNGHELDGRQLRVNEAEARPPRAAPRGRPSWSDDGGGGGGGGRPNFPPPSKPKGSRRNLRGKKRSL